MTVQLGAALPVRDGQVFCGGEWFPVDKVLARDPDVFFDFAGALGGEDTGLPWPMGNFGFSVWTALRPADEEGCEYLLAVVLTDLPVDQYMRGAA